MALNEFLTELESKIENQELEYITQGHFWLEDKWVGRKNVNQMWISRGLEGVRHMATNRAGVPER